MATARAIGAIAGVLPPLLILAWYVGTGGPPHGAPALVRLVIIGVVAGWVAGPRATGSIARQVMASINYFLVAYALEAIVDFAFLTAEDILAGRGTVAGVLLQRLWDIGFVRLAYLPVWALYLSPAIASWLVAVLVLRRAVRRVRAVA